jgi:sulfite exporter TauE/SafE
MADVRAGLGHVVLRVVVGLAYVVAGVAVILAQVEDVRLHVSVVAPAALMLLGLGLLATALVDAHLGSRASSS